MSPRVLVLGGSDQGRQTIDAIEAAGEHEVVGVLDTGLAIGTEVGGYRVLGPLDMLGDCARTARADAFVVAIGDNATRGRVLTTAEAECPDLQPCSVIHPGAVVARDVVVGPGSTILAGAVVSNGCTLGTGVLLGTNSSLDHDGTLAEFGSLGPGATTGGRVAIGSSTAIGLGANVIHQVSVGSHTVVGAGALVLEDLPDLVVAYGVPARVVRPRAVGDPYL